MQIDQLHEKTVEMSRSSKVELLFSQHMNGTNRLFGGVLMEWIDVLAAIVARRHSGKQVTTARVDSLVFAAPAYLNDLLFLEGKVVYVGKTSMDVKVDTYAERNDGSRHKINTAYLTLVALDETEKPTPVPRLKLITEEEQAEWQKAIARRQN